MNSFDGSSSDSLMASRRTTIATRDLSSQRNVRFSDHLKVRTYNLVLGDHPLCSNGLAIEHGWEYDSHDGEKVDMKQLQHEDEEEDCSSSSSRHNNNSTNAAPSWSSRQQQHVHVRRRRNISCPRRSHLDKKRLLLEVAGCSEDELNERTNTYHEEQQRQAAAERQRQFYINQL